MKVGGRMKEGNSGSSLKIAMFGHKRIPSREGGIEVVVAELATRMAALGHAVTCYNRSGHHVSGQEFDEERAETYQGVRLKDVWTLDKKGLAAMTASVSAAFRTAFGRAGLAETGADERDRVLEPFGEFLEVFLVQEDLVLVVGETPVVFLTALAFGDGQVEIIVPLRGLDIEKIGTLSCTDRLRIDVFRVSLLGAGPLVIFTVHDCVLKFDLFTNVGNLFKNR